LDASAEGTVRINYLLIDLENVKPDNLGLVAGGQFKVKVFVGANQKNLPVSMAMALQSFGPDAEYIQIDGHGKNALDFHIAFYIGRLAADDPNAYFHIISGDTGFDPLIVHLRSKKIYCQRSTSIESIPLVKMINNKSVPDRVAALLEFLRTPNVTKPRTRKTLGNMIRTKFANQLSDEDVEQVIEALIKKGAIGVQETKVTYHLGA
jgi:hypothetical protein